MLGLPAEVTACLFDLDGVLTQTAKVHAAAWQQMFDDYLCRRAAQTNTAFVPFDPVRDYDEYVDGKPRYDGVRSFLAARGIELREGEIDDPPDAETVHGLGNRKNEIVLKLIHEQGVEPYAIASVTLDVGVNVIAGVVGCTADELKIGMKVKPYWHPLANGEHLLMWQPDKDAA